MPGTGIGAFLVGEAQQIIGAGAVIFGKGDQNLGRDVPFAGFIIGIANLRAPQIFRKVFLQLVRIFPQISDPFIHFVHLHQKVFTKKYI